MYDAGAVDRPEKGKTPEKYAPLSQANSTGQAKVIGDKILEKERNRGFELSRNDRFRYRTRYFTDSGIIGSKEFVSKTYMRFKHHFNSNKVTGFVHKNGCKKFKSGLFFFSQQAFKSGMNLPTASRGVSFNLICGFYRNNLWGIRP